MENIEPLIKDLPEPRSAVRFLDEFAERHPPEHRRLTRNRSLLSDVLAISSYSPLLATTLLQNPGYVRWLGRERRNSQIREKDELLESLARFALTHSTLEPSVMLTRFRRRELIRIFLKDLRNLGTIAEITEDISNLADAILEYALQLSRQELDNRFGMPLENDEQGKSTRAAFCVIALGKLGSKELNYSSDIDLLFLYSHDGTTSGHGSRGGTTNKEYFVKLSEFISKLVGDPSGEGGAYRVDHRLRPHGRVGTLAISLKEARSYYRDTARLWEKQVLIRSRNSAGDPALFQQFYHSVEPFVFSEKETVENALANVLRSKQKIDLEKIRSRGTDVKLGVGGIREIEFIAQALQLAYGAADRWLRAPHTLISLSRLSDRKLISEPEFTQLHEAYVFLRRVEHRLQMEHGLQTHLVPDDEERLALLARRMGFERGEEFKEHLLVHTGHVSRIFKRFFDQSEYVSLAGSSARATPDLSGRRQDIEFEPEPKLSGELSEERLAVIEALNRFSRPFAALLRSNADYVPKLPGLDANFREMDYAAMLDRAAVEDGFAARLGRLRKEWAHAILALAVYDIGGSLQLAELKEQLTKLAEASVAAAMKITGTETAAFFGTSPDAVRVNIVALGKLGGGGMDYQSDLDLVLVYDETGEPPVSGLTHAEFYSKAVEIFVTTLSSMTREGSLYKVDLRLRPDGKNGATSLGCAAFFDYMRERSAVWEWLAYVKARSVLVPEGFPFDIEHELFSIIRKNVTEASEGKLKDEVRRLRKRLEQEKSRGRRRRSIDLKYGAGGLQDIYFGARFLQLVTGMSDRGEDRSTLRTLQRLKDAGAISGNAFASYNDGYGFLTRLDHEVRLMVGRSTLVPVGNPVILDMIAGRMSASSGTELLSLLAGHRKAVRAAFEEILGDA